MFIVPLFPALIANRFLADWTSHSRGSKCLLSLLCTQFSSELLSVTHSTVSRCFQPKIHPHAGTLVCLHSRSAFVLHSYFCLLLWTMGNTVRMALQTEEAFLTITRLERTSLHVARSLFWYSIPVKADTVVEKRYPKINLEIMSALIFVPVFLPFWLSNTLLSKKCHNSVLSMNNPIQCPAKNPNVPPVSADACWVIMDPQIHHQFQCQTIEILLIHHWVYCVQ